MLLPNCYIKIGGITARYVNSVEVKSSWKNLTDTCSLKFPRALKSSDGRAIDTIVNFGDKVEVWLGYGTNLKLRFKGYITEKGAATALAEFAAEDEMWTLKQVTLVKSWANANIEDVVKYIKQKAGANWNYDVLGQTFTVGALEFDNISAAKALQKLRDDYGVYSFFRYDAEGNPVLTVGKPYSSDAINTPVTFQYGKNVIHWRDLAFKSKSEVKLKVKITNHKPDGTKVTSEAGDLDGETRSLDFYNLSDAELKQQAEEYIKLLKYDGYRGSLPAFGEPAVFHGNVAKVVDKRYPNRQGNYYIDAVTTTFGINGYKQKIELGPKAA